MSDWGVSSDLMVKSCLKVTDHTNIFSYQGHPSPAAKVTAPPPIALNNGSKNLTQDLLTAEVEINDSPARYDIPYYVESL